MDGEFVQLGINWANKIKDFDPDYIHGLRDFKYKAIKDLQSIVDKEKGKKFIFHDNDNNPYLEGIEIAIQVLKDLKAE